MVCAYRTQPNEITPFYLVVGQGDMKESESPSPLAHIHEALGHLQILLLIHLLIPP